MKKLINISNNRLKLNITELTKHVNIPLNRRTLRKKKKNKKKL